MSTKTARLGLTKPDVTDDVTQTIKDLAKNFDLLDAMFPVGAIYQSTKPTDPSTFLGGTWQALNGGGSQWTARSADTYTNYRFQVDAVGGGQPHNNMPPYRAVYMWERVA